MREPATEPGSQPLPEPLTEPQPEPVPALSTVHSDAGTIHGHRSRVLELAESAEMDLYGPR